MFEIIEDLSAKGLQTYIALEGLEAQKDIVILTIIGLCVSAGGLVVTLISLRALYISLGLTKASVVIAEKTATASVDAVTANRAWIMPDGYENDEYIDDKQDGGYVFRLKWKNFGQTPAIKVRFIADHSLIELDPNNPVDLTNLVFPKFDNYLVDRDSDSFLPQGSFATSRLIPLLGNDYERWTLSKVGLIMHGYCQYEDIYGVLHKSEVTIIAIVNGIIQDNKTQVLMPRIEVQVVGRQNIVT